MGKYMSIVCIDQKLTSNELFVLVICMRHNHLELGSMHVVILDIFLLPVDGYRSCIT